jgi:hypothetical protein
MHKSSSDPHAGGAHTQFKDQLKGELHKRLGSTVKQRAGPSFDERIGVAVKAMKVKAMASEAEQRKTLTGAIEKGRGRPVSAPIRKASETPNMEAMLRERRKKMKEDESDYNAKLEEIKDKMANREPLFRLSDVSAAFAMQRKRAEERRQQMVEDEHQRWEHLRSVELGASKRPLLIEDPTYKAPPKVRDNPPADEGYKVYRGDREEYEKDIKIRAAINSPAFLRTDWAKQVAAIKEKTDNRMKLNEISYPPKGIGLATSMANSRMMHNFAAQVPRVY